MRPCPTCHGDGLTLDDDDLARRCAYCEGSGHIAAPPPATGYGFTSRNRALAVACPRCGAAAFAPCIGARKVPQARTSCHTERHGAAIAAGAPVIPR